MDKIRKRKGPIFRIETDEISMDDGSEMKIDDDQRNKHYQNDMMPSYASQLINNSSPHGMPSPFFGYS